MKNKQELDKEKNEGHNIKEEDIEKEVEFVIDKDAFKGPFTCHKNKTVLEHKKISIRGIDFTYDVWRCKTCKKEYLDSEQGKQLEKFWIIEKLLEDSLITMERNLNYDGKTYFFRFPKELTKNIHKDDVVDIKLLTPDGKNFLVEIKQLTA